MTSPRSAPPFPCFRPRLCCVSKVLCVDAGHLKGTWGGQMLIVTFKDANNTLVHLATAICDKENSDNYAWLYKQMKKNTDMRSVLDDSKTTLFTDQHKSHKPALE